VDMESSERDCISIACAGSGFEPLLSADEAAAHLRIHPKTLQRLARAGEVPCIRFGKYWRFHLSSLDAWVRSLENQCSQPFCVKRSGEHLEIHA
jgi:excisionase family DNA binding protein